MRALPPIHSRGPATGPRSFGVPLPPLGDRPTMPFVRMLIRLLGALLLAAALVAAAVAVHG